MFLLIITWVNSHMVVLTCTPPQSLFVPFSVVLIKIVASGCLLLCFCQLSLTWLTFIRITLSGDIETNPADFANGFFTFCNWDLNSLAKDDFYRVELLEVHNSIHNDTVELPDVLMENYTFVSCNNPGNTRNGGVDLFYKNDLPIK